jgi:hypothetical protein
LSIYLDTSFLVSLYSTNANSAAAVQVMHTAGARSFLWRKLELAALDRAWKRHRAAGQMLLLYGGRRLGKTFLLQRYFAAGVDGDEHEKPQCYFLAEQFTADTQWLTLGRQLIAALSSEGVAAEEIIVSSNALLRYASQ